MIKDIADNVELRSICALGAAAAWPIQGLHKHFRQEMLQRIEDFTDISYNLNKDEMFGHPAAFDWRRTPKTFSGTLDSFQDSTYRPPAPNNNTMLDQYPHIPLYEKQAMDALEGQGQEQLPAN